jgi:hypothetical protein
VTVCEFCVCSVKRVRASGGLAVGVSLLPASGEREGLVAGGLVVGGLVAVEWEVLCTV